MKILQRGIDVRISGWYLDVGDAVLFLNWFLSMIVGHAQQPV